jgi:hypothetical protein
MIPVPSPVEGFTIEHDASNSRWRLSAGGSTTTLRPWTWGERRRLLATSTMTGALDRSVFLPGLFDLVLDGPVPDVAPASLAVVCLHLLRVPENAPVLALSRAELLVATNLGWSPQQIDTEPADNIDRLLDEIQPQSGGAADDGWIRIFLAAAGSTSIEQRLESMLMTVARLAGLNDAVAVEPSVAPTLKDVADTLPAGQVQSEQRPHEALELTFGGVARLKPRGQNAESKSEPAADFFVRSSEPRIARVTSRVQARGEAPLLNRFVQPEHVVESEVAWPSQAAATDPGTGPRMGRHAASLAALATPRRPAPLAHTSDPHTRIPLAEVVPTFRSTVVWPAAPTSTPSAGESVSRSPDALASTPFHLSELEEQIADILDRAAREAGIDLP